MKDWKREEIKDVVSDYVFSLTEKDFVKLYNNLNDDEDEVRDYFLSLTVKDICEDLSFEINVAVKSLVEKKILYNIDSRRQARWEV